MRRILVPLVLENDTGDLWYSTVLDYVAHPRTQIAAEASRSRQKAFISDCRPGEEVEVGFGE